MKTAFRYVHLDHSPALEELAERKLESVAHLVAGYGEPRVEVEFERTTEHHKSGDVFKVSMRLFLHGKEIDAHATGADPYALVDEARDILHGAVVRFKDQDVARRHAEE